MNLMHSNIIGQIVNQLWSFTGRKYGSIPNLAEDSLQANKESSHFRFLWTAPYFGRAFREPGTVTRNFLSFCNNKSCAIRGEVSGQWGLIYEVYMWLYWPEIVLKPQLTDLWPDVGRRFRWPMPPLYSSLKTSIYVFLLLQFSLLCIYLNLD